MEKKYFYFQPQYVSKFKCDGSKCNAHCCNAGWNIFIDKGTYSQYEQLDSQEILSHMKFSSEHDGYFITLDEKKTCPFLNEKNLCRIQLAHGENFLSKTCATYPRITNNFGYFFERSLILSCPVAAEMILFECAPMQFEFVKVPEKFHSLGGKNFFQSIHSTKEVKEHFIEIQVAMISILQERTLSIDQRLVVLGFFVDRLEEIFSDLDEDALKKLIAAYESKKFLADQVPRLLACVSFNAEKFIRFIIDFLEHVRDIKDDFDPVHDEKFFGILCDVFKLNVAEVSISVANYNGLADERKKFLADYSTFLENYLVNELFLNIYPWQFEGNFMKNFAAFATLYKFFEAITFSVWLKGLSNKKNLLELTCWFATKFDHVDEYKQKIFSFVKNRDEPFSLMESLFDVRG